MLDNIIYTYFWIIKGRKMIELTKEQTEKTSGSTGVFYFENPETHQIFEVKVEYDQSCSFQKFKVPFSWSTR